MAVAGRLDSGVRSWPPGGIGLVCWNTGNAFWETDDEKYDTAAKAVEMKMVRGMITDHGAGGMYPMAKASSLLVASGLGQPG